MMMMILAETLVSQRVVQTLRTTIITCRRTEKQPRKKVKLALVLSQRNRNRRVLGMMPLPHFRMARGGNSRPTILWTSQKAVSRLDVKISLEKFQRCAPSSSGERHGWRDGEMPVSLCLSFRRVDCCLLGGAKRFYLSMEMNEIHGVI